MNFFNSKFDAIRRALADRRSGEGRATIDESTASQGEIVQGSHSTEVENDEDERDYDIDYFILEIERRWLATRVYEGEVFFGQHASGTIPEKKKPHQVLITTDEAQFGHWMPAHDIGHQLCGKKDRIVLVVDDAMMLLMMPGARFKVRLVWSEKDGEYDIFEEVRMELLQNLD